MSPAAGLSNASLRELIVVDLGRLPYAEALERQLELVEKRARGEIPDHLLFVEHPPVVTVGRGGDRGDVVGIELPVVEIGRGGEATYHGPGQLVGYPILELAEGERDLHRYLRDLEEVLIRALATFGIVAGRHPPHTGVWVGGTKLASIGVAVRRWVTYHGFALNVDVDLAPFRTFRPCGLDGTVMSSMTRVLGDRAVDRVEVIAAVTAEFGSVFRRQIAKP